MTYSTRLFLTALTAVALAVGLRSQDVRELDTPVAHQVLLSATPATISNQVANGFRLVDLEYRSGSGTGSRFHASFVQNTGDYASGWWWYYGLTLSQVGSLLSSNNGRLIDLESYVDSGGTQRYACVMVSNTGSNAKAWWYYVTTSTSVISTQLSNNNARLVDLDTVVVSGTTYYLAVMISNTGSDQRNWWWYTNASASSLNILASSNNARLYDLERHPSGNGNWNCIMIQDPQPTYWTWHYGLTGSQVGFLLDNYGHRCIDIEWYPAGITTRYAMLTINNSNELTTDVGNAMRSLTDGQVGCWLQQINGPNLANLNGTKVFEPASTMKTLHHVHAMRRVALGASSLTQPINVFTDYDPNNDSCPVDTSPVSEQLQVVLRDMMEDSDNARTQAITAYYGQSAINSTASALGMNSTDLNHRLGCGVPAVNNPNETSLADLHELHEAVANGYLGSYRDTFYELMNDNTSNLSIANTINSEAASLGLSTATRQSFINFTRVAHKGGNYGLSNGGPLYFERAEFGWLSLPFIVNDTIVPREYSFGLFVNDASNDTLAEAAMYSGGIQTLLRSTIRAALESWNGSLAGVQVVGAGCGSPLFSQTAQNLPRVGDTVTYQSLGGYPTSITAFVLGTSDSNWSGIPLPAPITAIGGEPGCMMYCDPVAVDFQISNSVGGAAGAFAVPDDIGLIGIEYLSQFWSFGPTTVKTTNGLRSIVGL